jgi:phosphate-selective porin
MPTQTDAYLWAIARNAAGRPMTQHAVTSTTDAYTVCGYLMTGWSRIYTGGPLEILACKRCLHATGASVSQRRATLRVVA